MSKLADGLSLDAETINDIHDRCGAPPLGGTLLEAVGDVHGWYFSSGGERIGPIHGEIGARYARANPDALCWRDGFDDWQPVSETGEFADYFMPAVHHVAGNKADDITFKVVGSETQFVEIELDPGESAIAEAGALMYKHPDIEMSMVFGDGDGQDAGFMASLTGPGKVWLQSMPYPRFVGHIRATMSS